MLIIDNRAQITSVLLYEEREEKPPHLMLDLKRGVPPIRGDAPFYLGPIYVCINMEVIWSLSSSESFQQINLGIPI